MPGTDGDPGGVPHTRAGDGIRTTPPDKAGQRLLDAAVGAVLAVLTPRVWGPPW